MSKLEVKADETKIDWLWATLQSTRKVPLLYSELLGPPFGPVSLIAGNRAGNLEFTALFNLDPSCDSTDLLPERFMARYMNTHLQQSNEVVEPPASVRMINGKPIVVVPTYRELDRETLLFEDPRRSDSTFTLRFLQGKNPQEKALVILMGGDGHQNIPFSSRADLAGTVARFHSLVANYTTAVWDSSGRPENNLAPEWQFPDTLQPQARFQAFRNYVGNSEIMGRKTRDTTRDYAIALESVGGLSGPKATLEAAIVDIESPSLSQQAGTNPYGEKIFLVTGDHGTGKTSLVRAFATELQRRVAQKGGFSYYGFNCASATTDYGQLTGSALDSVIRAAQDDVRAGRTALVVIENLDALYSFELTDDTEANRVAMLEAANIRGGVRTAVRDAYDFHVKRASEHSAVLQGYQKRIGQLRRYQQGITPDEENELESLEERLKDLKEQGLSVQLGPNESERLNDLRYFKHGLAAKEQRELARLIQEVKNPYFPTLVVVAETTARRSELGALSDVFRREVRLNTYAEDREDVLKALVQTAGQTATRSGAPSVVFSDIDYTALARATEGMTPEAIKELHLLVMNQAKLELSKTGQAQTITTATYLDMIGAERNYMAEKGELKGPLGFRSHSRS